MSMTPKDRHKHRYGMTGTTMWIFASDFYLWAPPLQDGFLDFQAYSEDLCFVTDPWVCSPMHSPFPSFPSALWSRPSALQGLLLCCNHSEKSNQRSETVSLPRASEGLFRTKSPSSNIDRVPTYRVKKKGCFPPMFIEAD